MTFDDILKGLLDGEIPPDEAVDDVCRLVNENSQPRNETPGLIETAKRIVDNCRLVLKVGQYSGCHRAAFIAAFHDTKRDIQVGGDCNFGYTRRPKGVLDCRLGTDSTSGTCIRETTGKKFVDYYGNCPSIHAAQNLYHGLPDRPEDVVWLEAGVVLVDGEFVPAVNDPKSDDYKKSLYRCTMCLKHVLAQGVTTLAMPLWTAKDGLTGFVWRDVRDNLSALIVCNIAEEMMNHER